MTTREAAAAALFQLVSILWLGAELGIHAPGSSGTTNSMIRSMAGVVGEQSSAVAVHDGVRTR